MAKTKTKPKPKAEPEAEVKPLHKFKLDDFRGGAVAGMLCLEAFKNPALLDPVRQWVADGLLEFGAGDSDVLDGVLFLKGVKPTPAVEEQETAGMPAVAKLPQAKLKPVAVEEEPPKPKAKPVPLGTVQDRVFSLVKSGVELWLWDQGKPRRVSVSRYHEPFAVVWWKVGDQIVSMDWRWESVERAMSEGVPLGK